MSPDKLRDLKFQVRRHMNGEVAQIMRGLDDAYKANYGTSLQHARDIASQEELSLDDCDELWQTGWRDLMLVALAAASRLNPPVDVVARWAASVPTLEMADAIPFLLSGAMPCGLDFASALVDRDANFDFAIAANTIGRMIVALQRPDLFISPEANGKSSDLSSAEAQEWLSSVSAVSDAAASMLHHAMSRGGWSFAEARAISFLARQVCRLRRYGSSVYSFSVAALVADVLTNSASRPEDYARAVADDIDSEMAMLDSLC